MWIAQQNIPHIQTIISGTINSSQRFSPVPISSKKDIHFQKTEKNTFIPILIPDVPGKFTLKRGANVWASFLPAFRRLAKFVRSAYHLLFFLESRQNAPMCYANENSLYNLGDMFHFWNNFRTLSRFYLCLEGVES